MLGYYNRLVEAKEKYGDVVIAYDGKESLRYSDILSAITRYREILGNMGVEPGEKVTLCAYNSCEWIKAFFGVICYGAVAVLMNYSLPEDDIISLMGQMDSSAFLYGNFGALEKDILSPERIQKSIQKRIDIRELSFERKENFEYIPLDEEAYANPAFVVFTSGSTGTPKGGMLSQRSNITGADAYTKAIPQMGSESICMAVPLFHIFGLGTAMAHLLHGGKLILPDKFASETVNDFIRENQPAALAAVMTVIVRTMEDNKFPKEGYPFIERIYTGGAPLLPIQVMRVEKGFGNAVLLNSYGQTESDTGIAITRAVDSVEQRVHSVGKPLSHREVVIRSSDGTECKCNEVGEITLRNNGYIMCNYYKVSEELQAIDVNGYLHTGDLGFIDEEGYLHLNGRIKDIIIKGGENIIPSEIEAVINTIPGIREVKVFGAADELYGENIHACLTLSPGSDLDESKIKKELEGKISRFKMPVNFFIFEGFPLKTNGKIDLCALMTLMLRRLDIKRIEADIENGIKLFSIEAMRRRNIIRPIVMSFPTMLDNMGFSQEKIAKIELCIEELLVERAEVNYIGSGKLEIGCYMFNDFARFSYYDDNPERPFSKRYDDPEKAVGAKIITRYADRIIDVPLEKGLHEYRLDFLYDRDFSPEDYLMV